MDSVTQFVLGASVGEAVAGKRAGNWAMLWGGICGTIPDLDVLMRFFYDEITMIGVHRGFSHSILFAFLIAPLLAFIQFKIHKKQEANYKDWLLLSFLAVVTHPILDAFTVYGTQLFQPFSDYPVAFNSIFIIDLFYTLPFIIGLIIILFFNRHSKKRRLINNIVLVFTTFYLLLGLISKYSADEVFEDNFEKYKLEVINDFSSPSPLNIILWNSIFVAENDTAYVAVYSHLDSDKNVKFEKIARNTHLIQDNLNDEVIKKLMWFSRGLYTVIEDQGELYFIDLRFSRSDFYISQTGSFIFKFRLIYDGDKVVNIGRERPKFDLSKQTFIDLYNRVLGD